MSIKHSPTHMCVAKAGRAINHLFLKLSDATLDSKPINLSKLLVFCLASNFSFTDDRNLIEGLRFHLADASRDFVEILRKAAERFDIVELCLGQTFPPNCKA